MAKAGYRKEVRALKLLAPEELEAEEGAWEDLQQERFFRKMQQALP